MRVGTEVPVPPVEAAAKQSNLAQTRPAREKTETKFRGKKKKKEEEEAEEQRKKNGSKRERYEDWN